ncbi:MAG: hypothetical protein JWM64_2896, partial [Frankiales bacterium]|nr:hypothetical protein [Frankiales bacterium]
MVADVRSPGRAPAPADLGRAGPPGVGAAPGREPAAAGRTSVGP